MSVNATIYKDLKVKNGTLKIKNIKIFNMHFKKDDSFHNNFILNESKERVKLSSVKNDLNYLFENLDRFTKIEKDCGDVDFVYNNKTYSFVNFLNGLHLSIIG